MIMKSNRGKEIVDTKIDLKVGEVICYCERKRKIFVGGTSFAVYRIAGAVGILVAVVIMALEGGNLLLIGIFLGVYALYLLVERSSYVSYKKKMLADGHTELCSRKIAIAGMLKSSMYYPFKIMD